MLSIVIPDDVNLLDPLPSDFNELVVRLQKSPRRSCLFVEEKITAYVLHSCEQGQQPPPELYMTVSWALGKTVMIPGSEASYDDFQDHDVTTRVTELLMAGNCDVFAAGKAAAVWKFTFVITNPLRTMTGSIRFAVSIKNPHTPLISQKANGIEEDGTKRDGTNRTDGIETETDGTEREGTETDGTIKTEKDGTETNGTIKTEKGITKNDGTKKVQNSNGNGPIVGSQNSPIQKLHITHIDDIDQLNQNFEKTEFQYQNFEQSEFQNWSHSSNLLNQLNQSISGGSARSFNFSLGQQRISENVNNVSKSPDPIKSPDYSTEGLLGSVRNVAYTRATLSHADSAVLELDTVIPLSLKLKSVKPAGRNDIIISTLCMEASDKVLSVASKTTSPHYVIWVLDISASLKGGKVALLGRPMVPCCLAITDALNLSYKITDIDTLGLNTPQMLAAPAYAPGSAPTTPLSTSTMTRASFGDLPRMKTLEIKVHFRVQRMDPYSGGHVTVVEQASSATIPIHDMSSPIQHSRASVMQPRRAATNFLPAKKSVTINNVVSYGHNSPSERFSTTTNTTLSSPILIQTKSQTKRKAQMSVGSLSAHNSSFTVNITSNQPSPLNGLVLTFTGDFSICVGCVVTWKVQVVNKASRPLQTSLQFRASRASGSSMAAYNRGSPSTVSLGQFSGSEDDKNVVPQPQLMHQYTRVRPEKPGIVVLSNDVSLGHLDVNQVYETELKLVGLCKGVYGLSGLKLVESSGDAVDFGRLLEVFVT